MMKEKKALWLPYGRFLGARQRSQAAGPVRPSRERRRPPRPPSLSETSVCQDKQMRRHMLERLLENYWESFSGRSRWKGGSVTPRYSYVVAYSRPALYSFGWGLEKWGGAAKSTRKRQQATLELGTHAAASWRRKPPRASPQRSGPSRRERKTN